MIHADALGAIGHTPLVQLRRVVPKDCARILVKLEFANPTGSMKDRVAKAIVEGAVRSGKIKPGWTIVEYTGGTTGVSLAMVCAVMGFRLHLVFSDAFSEEKRATMKAFGAEVTDVKSDHKKIQESLFREMIATAERLSQEPEHWWSDQLRNRDGMAGYHPLGEEIWAQTGGKLEAFVQMVGTAQSLHGCTQALWKHDRSIQAVAVEPRESAVLSGGASGAHGIEGVGVGFLPPLWDRSLVNEITTVHTRDAEAMARRLCREEGLFVGTSSGGNVAAAIEVGRRLGPKATVVTLMVDSGLRYLSTELFAPPR